MNFSFSKKQIELKEEIENFIKENLSEDLIEQLFLNGETHNNEFYKKLAQKGYLGLSWPKEFGGSGGSRLDMAIFMEIMGYYEAPMGGFGSTVGLFGQSIIYNGSDEIKKEFLPKIASGEIICCLGITEPDAGSDVKSIKTKAIRNGDDFILNGTKTFITSAHLADYMLTLTRTENNEDKQKGLTFFIVNLKSKGVEIKPIKTSSGWRVNQVFLEDVKVNKKYIVGKLNEGWRVLIKTLGMERVGLGNLRNAYRLINELTEYAIKKNKLNNAHIKSEIARLLTSAEISRLLYYNASWRQDKGKEFTLDASISKLFTSFLYHHLGDTGVEIIDCDEKSRLKERIDFWFKHCVANTIGGGTTQVQRNLISSIILGDLSEKKYEF